MNALTVESGAAQTAACGGLMDPLPIAAAVLAGQVCD